MAWARNVAFVNGIGNFIAKVKTVVYRMYPGGCAMPQFEPTLKNSSESPYPTF
jgi:hypothetical protein